jgi:hypothetical protein
MLAFEILRADLLFRFRMQSESPNLDETNGQLPDLSSGVVRQTLYAT